MSGINKLDITIESFSDFLKISIDYSPTSRANYQVYKAELVKKFMLEDFSNGTAERFDTIEELLSSFRYEASEQVVEKINNWLETDTTFNRTFKGEK